MSLDTVSFSSARPYALLQQRPIAASAPPLSILDHDRVCQWLKDTKTQE